MFLLAPARKMPAGLFCLPSCCCRPAPLFNSTHPCSLGSRHHRCFCCPMACSSESHDGRAQCVGFGLQCSYGRIEGNSPLGLLAQLQQARHGTTWCTRSVTAEWRLAGACNWWWRLPQQVPPPPVCPSRVGWLCLPTQVGCEAVLDRSRHTPLKGTDTFEPFAVTNGQPLCPSVSFILPLQLIGFTQCGDPVADCRQQHNIALQPVLARAALRDPVAPKVARGRPHYTWTAGEASPSLCSVRFRGVCPHLCSSCTKPLDCTAATASSVYQRSITLRTPDSP